MGLKGKPVAIATIVKPEAAKSWQTGKTYVQYVVTYEDAKGERAVFTPTREWVADDSAVICNKLLANAIATKAMRTQANFEDLGAVIEDAGLFSHAFALDLSPAIITMLALGGVIGGDTQVAFFTEKNKDSREFRAWKKARNS